MPSATTVRASDYLNHHKYQNAKNGNPKRGPFKWQHKHTNDTDDETKSSKTDEYCEPSGTCPIYIHVDGMQEIGDREREHESSHVDQEPCCSTVRAALHKRRHRHR